MGYRPSGLARGLSTNRTYTVGFLVPDNSHHFFSLMVRGAEAFSSDAGYSLLLANTLKNQELETSALNNLWDRRVDGAILYASLLSPEQLTTYIERLEHVVFINSPNVPMLESKSVSINVDDQLGARIAVQHFVSKGHTQIALISAPMISSSGRRRLDGYRQALSDFGLPVDEDLICECIPHTEGGYNAVTHLLQAHPDITAILAYNDLSAIGAIRACEDHGKKIPDDIAIIGFDDIPMASLLRPSLSTVRIDKQALGSLAMETLLGLIEGNKDTPQIQIIQPRLILRQTTRS
jgi:DNA-binding LacI/PurR family transcriptional regulator